MSREDHGLTFRNFISLIDEYDSTLFERCNYMLVMNDFFTDIEWGSIELE